MSCPTILQPISLNVSAGSLPEGFCPASMQELFTAMAARLIITPNQGNTSFAAGSIEPTSNVGPWFKNCEELFVFDDSTARYVPITSPGNLDNVQVFSASGTFIVPDDIYRIKVEAWGGGGGGANNSGPEGGGGGGGGGYGLSFFNVLPAQAIPVVVGSPGGGGAPGTPGTASTFLTLSAGGGAPGTIGTGMGGEGGIGGVVTGAQIPVNGQNGITSDGVLGQSYGGEGGDSPNGGGGGTSSITAAKLIGVTPGGGGAGGTNAAVNLGGAGAPGRVVVWF